jgi:hypothetical protein
MASIASATAARDEGGGAGTSSGSGTGSMIGVFFFALGGCEAARLSTGIPMKFRGDVKTDPGAGREKVDVGFDGTGDLSLGEGEGRGGRGFHARLLLKVLSEFSVDRVAAFSSVFIAVLIGDREAGGLGRGSRGGGHAWK